MDDIERQSRLSCIHVRRSAPDRAFVAWSDQFPGLTCSEASSLAAADGLLDVIRSELTS